MHSPAQTVLPASASAASTYGASPGPAPITPPRDRPPPAGGGVCAPPRPPAGGCGACAAMTDTVAAKPSAAIHTSEVHVLRMGILSGRSIIRQVLRGSTGFYKVQPGSTRFYKVLRGSTGFCQVRHRSAPSG